MKQETRDLLISLINNELECEDNYQTDNELMFGTRDNTRIKQLIYAKMDILQRPKTIIDKLVNIEIIQDDINKYLKQECIKN